MESARLLSSVQLLYQGPLRLPPSGAVTRTIRSHSIQGQPFRTHTHRTRAHDHAPKSPRPHSTRTVAHPANGRDVSQLVRPQRSSGTHLMPERPPAKAIGRAPTHAGLPPPGPPLPRGLTRAARVVRVHRAKSPHHDPFAASLHNRSSHLRRASCRSAPALDHARHRSGKHGNASDP